MVICTFFLFIFILRWLLPFQHYFSFYISKEKSNDGREISVLVIPLRLIFFSFLFRYAHTSSSMYTYVYAYKRRHGRERETRAQPPAQPMKLQKRRWKKINKQISNKCAHSNRWYLLGNSQTTSVQYQKMVSYIQLWWEISTQTNKETSQIGKKPPKNADRFVVWMKEKKYLSRSF
jgi:hypothetical protein